MGQIILDISQRRNQIPNSSGWLRVDLDYNQSHTFTLANFTTETTPPYSDPDGDPLGLIKITSLPSQGELKLNSVSVSVNDEITASQLSAGNLIYTSDASDTDGYSDSFMSFVVADNIEALFTSSPNSVTFEVSYDVVTKNEAPSQVGNGNAELTLGESFVFTRASLTSQLNPPYDDPEGNPAYQLKITKTPLFGKIKLNDVDVVDNQIIDFSDIDLGKLKYVSEEFPGGEIEGFVFEVSDTGSQIFST